MNQAVLRIVEKDVQGSAAYKKRPCIHKTPHKPLTIITLIELPHFERHLDVLTLRQYNDDFTYNGFAYNITLTMGEINNNYNTYN